MKEPTREDNILDLVLTSIDNLISNLEMGRKLGSSDHQEIRLRVKWDMKPFHVKHLQMQALSVVALGKMCLQHEEQAKRIVPALGCMLTVSTPPAIKNNILFTLSDMCVR